MIGHWPALTLTLLRLPHDARRRRPDRRSSLELQTPAQPSPALQGREGRGRQVK